MHDESRYDDAMTRRVERAIAVARRAWDRAHAGLPASVMTRSAAIPATGILAAALLEQLDESEGHDVALSARVEAAIRTARLAWERTHDDPPGNPIAQTATRSVIGILAAGILNYQNKAGGPEAPAPGPTQRSSASAPES